MPIASIDRVLRCFNSRTPGGVRLLSIIPDSIFYTSFNSRTPGGVRRKVGGIFSVCDEFQFTHPGRGATLWSCQ